MPFLGLPPFGGGADILVFCRTYGFDFAAAADSFRLLIRFFIWGGAGRRTSSGGRDAGCGFFGVPRHRSSGAAVSPCDHDCRTRYIGQSLRRFHASADGGGLAARTAEVFRQDRDDR